MKYYNNCLFYEVQKDYLAQSGDPTNTGAGGTSIWGLLSGSKEERYFNDELSKKRTFNKPGLVAMANKGPNMNGSGFFVTLGDLTRDMS
jgi:peptidyl-prolyl cis-trans isomerase-like 4